MIVIIAGFAVSAIVVIGTLASVMLNKGESVSNCIANMNTFESGSKTKEECEKFEKEQLEKSYSAINGNYGYVPGSYNYLETPEQIAQKSREELMKKDLDNFYDMLENYYAKNGQYPDTSHQLAQFNFFVDESHYPSEDYNWNFEYCESMDRQEFVVIVYTGDEDEIMYVSSNDRQAETYVAKKEDLHKYVRNGEWTGGYISPCYSGTSYSAADRAGLGQVGQLNEEKNLVVAGQGSSGINHEKGTGWAQRK